ncbi:MAG: hypothetical protein ACM3NF_07765 [Gemmatimonadota bacterium]
MRATASPGRLIEVLGGMYSRELGIDLSRADGPQAFRRLLAAKLMGARIATRAALATWKEFDRRGVDSPEGIRRTGWDGIVAILDAGGYARYDFSTATRLLAIADDLLGRYRGDLNVLHERSAGPRIAAPGRGIDGPDPEGPPEPVDPFARECGLEQLRGKPGRFRNGASRIAGRVFHELADYFP